MRFTAIFGMLAAGALATPLQHRHNKRQDVVVVDQTDVVTDYTTVVAGSSPTSAAAVQNSVVVVTTVVGAQPTVNAGQVQAQDFHAPAPQAPAPAAAPVVPAPSSAAPAPSSSASASSAAAPAGDYASQAVAAHNTHRNYHSAGNIAWDSNLASIAAITANSCNFTHDVTTGKGSVDNGNGYGQNIAAGVDSPIADVINGQWYGSEPGGEAYIFGVKQLYGMKDPTGISFDSWGHFSQLVWVGSTTVGCHTAQCSGGVKSVDGFMNSFTVCNYAPAGNMQGSFGTNVLPPQGSAA